jgi:hypothetical protein
MSNTLWPTPVQSVLGCKIPHELDALKWKATGKRRRDIEQERKMSLPLGLEMIISGFCMQEGAENATGRRCIPRN